MPCWLSHLPSPLELARPARFGQSLDKRPCGVAPTFSILKHWADHDDTLVLGVAVLDEDTISENPNVNFGKIRMQLY